ncbi:MAG: pilus assembly protein PilM [Verrucomicrobiota bacterium]
MPAGRVLTADLGSSSLKLAEFQVDKSGSLKLLNYIIEDLGLDPNKEQDRTPFLSAALQKGIQKIGAGSANINSCVSGHLVFTRFVKLPPVPQEQLNQMIVFEAQQNVPFPIDEVVWDYQLLGGAAGLDTEALIVAMKGDLVEDLGSLFGAIRLKSGVIDVAPLTLINAFKYNYAEHSDCSLIIDIGAKSSNLIFVDEGQVFCRTVPIAGHLISQNISNEFQEPFAGAEVLKRGKGFVGLGGAYQDPDDAIAARISKIARSIFSRLHAEVTRSVTFYRNQQNGKQPARVYLTGGTAMMPYADLFFKDKLNLPIEFFNPFKNVVVAPSVNQNSLKAEGMALGSMVGLALREVENCPIEVKLVPPSVTLKKQQSQKTPYLVMASFIWIAFFVYVCGTTYFKADKISSEAQQLRRESQEKNQYRAEIDKVKTAYDLAKLKADSVLKMTQQRNFWVDTIDSIHQSVSPGLWITKIDLMYDAEHVEIVPKEDEAKNEEKNPRDRFSARKSANRKSAQVEETKQTLNLAPEGKWLSIRGLYEQSQSPEIVNNFADRLGSTELFDQENVEILQRENPDKDKIALEFYIKAPFAELTRVNLKP